MDFQIQGDSIGYYRLLFRLVAQKPLKFFQEHMQWIKSPDEKFAPQNEKNDECNIKPFTDPIKPADEGTVSPDTLESLHLWRISEHIQPLIVCTSHLK